MFLLESLKSVPFFAMMVRFICFFNHKQILKFMRAVMQKIFEKNYSTLEFHGIFLILNENFNHETETETLEC
jgi:hypothetical protein